MERQRPETDTDGMRRPRSCLSHTPRWLAAVLVLSAGCAAAPGRHAPPAVAPPAVRTAPGGRAAMPAAVRVRTTAGLRTLALEDYVAGVVAGELAVGALPREVAGPMLTLQAIVARTWAVAHAGRHRSEGFDFCTSTHCQVMREAGAILPANRDLIARAVGDSTGQVLLFDGRPIDAVFHADCGGATSAAETVWGGTGYPYLRPVEDRACALARTSAWSHRVGSEALRDALNQTAGTAVGRRLDGVRPLDRDGSGRIALVALDGERSPLVRGEELRAALARRFGAYAIRSTRFTVRREGRVFVFTGRGFGHGVGLCQRGALARLQAGETWTSVLAAYYPGTQLTPPQPADPPAARAPR